MVKVSYDQVKPLIFPIAFEQSFEKFKRLNNSSIRDSLPFKSDDVLTRKSEKEENRRNTINRGSM